MKNFNLSTHQKGFTLIEMAIVLVIIGLIIASITVSKDTMRTAEYNKAWSKFFSPWTQAAYDFYQRTGRVATACASTATCVTAMGNVGITLSGTYAITDEAGVQSNMTITSITDGRATAVADADTNSATGGMVVTYGTVPVEVAHLIDHIMDSDQDANGAAGLGRQAGDVRWSADIGNVSVSTRLRDITGAGSG